MKYIKVPVVKYRVVEEETFLDLPIWIPQVIQTEFIFAHKNVIIIKEGYGWDGPSGPAIDTPKFMRGSLVHDALYELIRNGHLSIDLFRKPADKCIVHVCKQDGMWWPRRSYTYSILRLFGNSSAEPNDYQVQTAP